MVITEWNWFRLELEDLESGTEQKIGEYSACHFAPSWSSDNRKLTFSFIVEPDGQLGRKDVAGCELYIYDLQFGDLTRLTNNRLSDADPAFSPDSSRLVFTSSEDGFNRLYIMNLATLERTLLTPNSFGYRATWSPDGQWITFMSNHKNWNDDIYVIKAGGTGFRRITSTDNFYDYPAWVTS